MTEFAEHQKRQSLLRLLDRGLVMIHLDPRRKGVVVPEQFADDPVLRLNVAYGFNLPALDVSLEGVYAVLSFSRHPFGCTIPWAAIFALTLPDETHEGYVWPESMPPELDPFFGDGLLKPPDARRDGPPPPPVGASPVGPTRPIAPGPKAASPFQVIEGGAPPEEVGDEGPDEPPPTPSRPVLRVVKG